MSSQKLARNRLKMGDKKLYEPKNDFLERNQTDKSLAMLIKIKGKRNKLPTSRKLAWCWLATKKSGKIFHSY